MTDFLIQANEKTATTQVPYSRINRRLFTEKTEMMNTKRDVFLKDSRTKEPSCKDGHRQAEVNTATETMVLLL